VTWFGKEVAARKDALARFWQRAFLV